LFRQRVVPDAYRYLFFDGVMQKVRSCGRVVKKLVLVAYGIKLDGTREVIDFRVAGSESEREWTMFLNSLYQRGLKGVGVRMMVTDGGRGLLAALDMVYPYIPRQRCWVHKLRNVANYLPRRCQADCLQEAKRIYGAAHYQQAVKRFKRWCRRWRDKAPKAVQCLEKDIEGLLTFFEQEKKLWIKLRTTNVIERMFRELRKRTRPMTHFVNVKSCERITFAVINKYNQKWEDRRYAFFK
jgi:putative transposase